MNEAAADPILNPPRPHAVLEVTSADGAVILARRHGNPDGPRVYLSHGNGFAIQGYYAFWRHFLDSFEVVLHDIRNHGMNPFHGAEGHHYGNFVKDWQALREAVDADWGKKPSAGLHHSAAALTSLHHLHDVAWFWDALVLFDPPIMPGPDHPLREEAQAFEDFMSSFAAGRPDRFKDPKELAAAFKTNRGLAGWTAGTHELMARAILRRDAESGDWVLACPKQMEADLYAVNKRSTLWSKLPAATAYADKILVICGDPNLPWSKVPQKIGPELPERFGIQQVSVEGTSHLLQLEEPEVCARLAKDFLSGTRFA